MTDTPRADARLHGKVNGPTASARRCSWWRALNRQIRAAAFDDLGNSIERYLIHPPLDRLKRRAVPLNRFERATARVCGDGSARPLPLRHSPEWQAEFLAKRAASIDDVRGAVRRYLDDGSDPPDEGNRSDLVSPLGELLLWYVVPDDEYGTSDGPCPDTLQFRRRDGCVDVTGYIDMMYYEIPQVRWDDSVSELMKGHWKRVMVRPFTAELRCEGESMVRIAAASEEVPPALRQLLAPTLVNDFVGDCAREIASRSYVVPEPNPLTAPLDQQ